MAGLVSEHQVVAFSDPQNGQDGDATVVLGNDNAIVTGYDAHDADGTIHVQSSALASRSPAGTAGRKWMTVDSTAVRVFYDNGSSWLELNTFGGGIAVTGNSTITGTLGGITTGTFTVRLTSATHASGSSFAATGGEWYAHNTNGASMGGYGSSYDAALLNRSGTAVLGVVANSTALTMASRLNTATASVGVSFAATGGEWYAHTSNGASMGGYGTSYDASLLNRAGTVVLGVGANGTTVTLAGALVVAGQLKTTVTTQQLALHYDADNHLAVTVSSAGAVTYNATGASAGHTFSDAVTCSSTLAVTGETTLSNNLRFSGNRTILYPSAGTLTIVNDTASSTQAVIADGSITLTSCTLVTSATAAARAGLNLPHGTAPSAPVDGDMWTTTAGLFVRINGSTVGPLS